MAKELLARMEAAGGAVAGDGGAIVGRGSRAQEQSRTLAPHGCKPGRSPMPTVLRRVVKMRAESMKRTRTTTLTVMTDRLISRPQRPKPVSPGE